MVMLSLRLPLNNSLSFVNIPAQEPQVGQAFCSISKNASLESLPSLNAPTASNIDDNVKALPCAINRFHRPTRTEYSGTLVLTNNIPGVILSQLGM